MSDQSFTIERIYIPSVEQSNAINATKDKSVNRTDMAEFYFDCMVADEMAKRRGDADRVDWKAVNLAIIERWSKSGLEHVKKLAWACVSSR